MCALQILQANSGVPKPSKASGAPAWGSRHLAGSHRWDLGGKQIDWFVTIPFDDVLKCLCVYVESWVLVLRALFARVQGLWENKLRGPGKILSLSLSLFRGRGSPHDQDDTSDGISRAQITKHIEPRADRQNNLTLNSIELLLLSLLNVNQFAASQVGRSRPKVQ